MRTFPRHRDYTDRDADVEGARSPYKPRHRAENKAVGTAAEFVGVKIIIPRHLACNTSADGRPCWPCRTGLSNHQALTTEAAA